MSPRDRHLEIIVMGTLRGGEYDYDKRKWKKPPTIL